jgi:hypothetical protein
MAYDDQVILDIGECLGLPMQRIEGKDDDCTTCRTYKGVVYQGNGDGKWYLRYRKYYGDDHSSAYSICLNTMRPCKSSPRQTYLPSDLQARLQDWFKRHLARKELIRTFADRPIGEYLEAVRRL